MSEIFSVSHLRDFITFFANGDINIITGFVWVLVATVLSMIGGAIGGMLLAGKDIGYNFSAILGGFFGPTGVIPAILLGLLLLNLLQNL
ncbi:MAG: hypothetical protein ACSI46_18875 [Gloeotrichia echinulata DVL01]|jgi:hypothetical protein